MFKSESYATKGTCNQFLQEYTRVVFFDNNDNTSWGVRANYNAHPNGYDLGYFTSYRTDGGAYIEIACYKPSPVSNPDTVHWLTSCVDPTVEVVADWTTENYGFSTVYRYYIDRMNVTCKQGKGGIYVGCDHPNNLGFVPYGANKCPANDGPECVAEGQIWNCDGKAYCGSDANRCTRYGPQECDYAGGVGSCKRDVNNNASGCLGVNGCQCLSNSDCTGTVCGGGSSCVLYGKRCSNGKCELNPNDVKNNNSSQCGANCGGSAPTCGPNQCGVISNQYGSTDCEGCGGDYCTGADGCTRVNRWCSNNQCQSSSTPNSSQCGASCTSVSYPNLVVTSFNFAGGNSGNNPDPGAPIGSGGTVSRNVGIANNGSVGTGAQFWVRVNNGVSAGSYAEVQTGALGAGATRTVTVNSVPWPATAGTYTAEATVDSRKQITEQYENNSATDNYTITSYIAGRVWVDSDSDGVKDANESYASGWTVKVAGTNYTTNANGYYQSAELSAGNHTASVNLPSGWTTTTSSSVTLNLGPNRWAQFGVRQATATTWVNVYVDSTQNCVWDGGETGYTGAGVSVSGQGAGYYTTNASGQFVLSNIPAGYSTYTLGTPSGYSIACVGNPQGVTTSPGGTYVVNFPIRRNLATTYVNVFVDLNANWVWDAGETGYSGATVTVSGQGAGTYTTNSNGQITVANIPTGYSTYTLTAPSGFSIRSTNPVGVTTPPSGQVVSFALRPTTAPSCTMSASPTAVNPGGTSSLTVNYSLPSQVTQQPSITWYPDTGNVPGAQIINTSINNAVRQAYGTWVSPNPYWDTSTAYPAVVICNAGTDPACNSCGLTVGSGITVVPLHSITGNVFVDTNRNGRKDGAEANYTGGVTITRSPAGGNLTYPSAGAYSITGLNVGDYTISHTNLPAGYERTTAGSFAVHPQNGACTTGGSPQATCTNGNISNLNFGIDLIPTYNISGNVFVDTNGDGRKNAGESNYTLGSITITRNPASGTLSYPSGGAYNITGLYAGDYTIYYTNKPIGYELTHPLSGPPPQFSVHVGAGGSCTTGGSNDGVCAGGSITSLNFGITNAIPWIQTEGANLWFNSAVDNAIPQDASCQSVFSKDLAGGGSPGVIYSGGTISIGPYGQISSRNWNVAGQNYSPVGGNTKTSYAYVKSHVNAANIVNMASASVCGAGGIANCQLSLTLANGVYRADGDLHLTRSSYSFPVNKDYVILINGDLYLEGDIDTPAGSTVLFTAGDENADGSGGNIYVAPNVGTSPYTSLSPNLEGWFSADKSFIIQASQVCPNPDERLNVEGAIIANAQGGGTFDNQRNLCVGNTECPVFYIKERPDLLLNAPRFLQAAPRLWQEVAP